MKHFLLLVLLLGGLVSCTKNEDPAPPVNPPATLIGKWLLVQQTSTDGQTTHGQTANPNPSAQGDYYNLFTGTEYVWLSGTQEQYRYPYTVSNGIIHIASTANGNTGNDFTIKELTGTKLVLTFLGGGSQAGFIFTNTYDRR